jgi:hypothetical protein
MTVEGMKLKVTRYRPVVKLSDDEVRQCTVCCTILYYTYTVPHYAVIFCTVLYYTTLYCVEY